MRMSLRFYRNPLNLLKIYLYGFGLAPACPNHLPVFFDWAG